VYNQVTWEGSDSMASLTVRARTLAIAQDFGAEALEVNRQLVTANPGDLASRTRLARCYREAGRIEEGEAEYREVLRQDPKNLIAAGGLATIEQARRGPEPEPVRRAAVARTPRPPRPTTVTSVIEASSVSDAPVPLTFSGFTKFDFAELKGSPARDVRARFSPRVVDFVKRINNLQSSREIASIRDASARQLFRPSRVDMHADTSRWFVYNTGARWEPQFHIRMSATRLEGEWLRIGIAFDLVSSRDGSDDGTGLRGAKDHFRHFQEILNSAPRSLFLGWMIKEDGRIELDHPGPREDLRQPAQAADAFTACDPDRTSWVFFGKWFSPDREDDIAVLADSVELVRAVDRTFLGLMPLWRALWAR
jgi:hypothetical protein